MDNSISTTMRTAVLTAYPKIFTDISYAPQIFFHSAQVAIKYGFSFQPSLFVSEMAIEIEARHKALNAVLNKIQTRDTLVIELGVGLSPRRCEFPHLDYLELDYPTIINMKKEIYKLVDLQCFSSGLIATDLCNQEEFGRQIKLQLKSKKYTQVIVVSEGLFWYLKKHHIQGIVNELTRLLDDVDWLWLTADCPVDIQLDASYKNVIAESSNKSPIEPFNDFDAFYDFFINNKFSVKRYSMTDLILPDDIYSGRFFSVSLSEVKKRMESYTDIAILKI